MTELSVEERLRRLEAEVKGECPMCARKVKGWKPPSGSFAPEAWATLRERGIDPATGHMAQCPERKKC